MKIAVSSDWHGHKPEELARKSISECDILLLCGDIFEPFHNNAKLENYFRSLKDAGKRIVMTPGNHDFGIYFGMYPELRLSYGARVAGCAEYKKGFLKSELGIDCLVDETIEVDGIRIHGTPWTPMFCNWAFMTSDDYRMVEKHSSMPLGTDILISHGPPYDENSKIDSCCPSLYDGQPEHLGSKVLTETILMKSPKMLFCGHIHSGSHDETVIGDTKCMNVSYLGEDYSPGYQIHVFEM